MKIEIGKCYENRTRDYLLPCLKSYGGEFIKRYGTIIKLAIGIHDCLLDGSSKSASKNIYILCDSKSYSKNFSDFLVWIRLEPCYVADYAIDAELTINSRKHMIVLLIPSGYHKAYDAFRVGAYSEMYTKEEIDLLFSEPSKKTIKLILQKHHSIREVHCNKVNKLYGTDSTPDDFKDCELEFPLLVHPETEIFNYHLNNRNNE